MEKNFTKVGGKVRFEFDTVGYVRGCAAGVTGERGSEFFFFFKKKETHMASGAYKTEAKRVSKKAHMASGGT